MDSADEGGHIEIQKKKVKIDIDNNSIWALKYFDSKIFAILSKDQKSLKFFYIIFLM